MENSSHAQVPKATLSAAKVLGYLLLAAFCATALVSAYTYARFTVDDAFITWRYGRNLVEFGVWGYNPTSFDLTQAYTNPIIAALSVVPAWAKLDTVLFFKLFSLLNLLVLALVLLRLSENKLLSSILLAAFLSLPASMVHLFGGLETFLYGSLLGLLFISLERGDARSSTALTVALILTRPEAWTLLALVPLFFFATDLKLRVAFPANRGLRAGVVLAAVFALYAGFHWWHFGYVLPNTFYIKSGGSFDSSDFFDFWLLYTLPLLVPFLTGSWKSALFAYLFFAPVAFNYASSALWMDYVGRFGFHIVMPCFILAVYAAGTMSRAQPSGQTKMSFRRALSPATMAGFLLILLAVFHNQASASAGIFNYYTRLLQSHAALGKELHTLAREGTVKSMAFGDAGVTAFHSRLVALDHFGLGSSLVGHNGVTDEVVAQYDPDILVLHGNAEGVAQVRGQPVLLEWASRNGVTKLCMVHFRPNYKLHIFSKEAHPALEDLCEKSDDVNNRSNDDYTLNSMRVPPWRWWRE